MAFIERGALVVALAAGCSGSDFTHADDRGSGGKGGRAGAEIGSSGATDAGQAGELGSGGSGGHAGGPPERLCGPGVTQACIGPGRCDGAQSCAADGLSWRACECASSGGSSDAGGTSAGNGSGGGSGSTGGSGGTAGASDPGGEPGVGGAGATSGAGAGGSAGAAAGGLGGAGAGGSGGSAGATGCGEPFGMNRDGFVTAPAVDRCWHGYAFAGGDSSSVVMFPGGGKDFSGAMGELRLKGTVGSATEANNYAGNVYLGFALNQSTAGSAKGTVTPAGSSITVTCSGCSLPPMRLHLVNSASARQWCADLVSESPVGYPAFSTECWSGGAHVAYAREPIDAIWITIPGGAVDANFDVTLLSVAEQ